MACNSIGNEPRQTGAVRVADTGRDARQRRIRCSASRVCLGQHRHHTRYAAGSSGLRPGQRGGVGERDGDCGCPNGRLSPLAADPTFAAQAGHVDRGRDVAEAIKEATLRAEALSAVAWTHAERQRSDQALEIFSRICQKLAFPAWNTRFFSFASRISSDYIILVSFSFSVVFLISPAARPLVASSIDSTDWNGQSGLCVTLKPTAFIPSCLHRNRPDLPRY